MSDFILHNINGLSIGLRQLDGYVNATRLTQAYKQQTGKRRDVHEWLNSKRTQEMLKHLGSVTGISVTGLYQVVQGGVPENQGTWIHPKLATRFAIWLSDDFGLMVENWVENWMTQKVKLTPDNPPYQIPQTLSQALFEAAKQAERAELAEAQNKQLQAQIEADKPKVALAEAIAFSDDSIDFNSYAKIIGTGRTRLFRAMRDCGVIMKNSTLPYQKWIDAGYFEISEELNMKTGQIHPFALVTGKGQIWLKQRLDHFKSSENSFVNAICSSVMGMSNFN
jgi:phage antirepressor YoqD-like protein